MDEETKHIIEILTGEYSERIGQIAKSTVPLFYKTKKDDIKIAGSSLFIRIENHHYLVSAAHVMGDNLEATFTMFEYEQVYLNGNHLASNLPPSGKREEDKIDLMVMQLDQLGTEKILTWYLPVSEDQLAVNHQSKDRFRYFMYGYPITRTRRKWNTNEIEVSNQAYAGNQEKTFDYLRFGFNKDQHLAIQFDGNGLSMNISNLHLIPDLKGISGSGLWYLDNQHTNLLVGIIIQRVNQPGQKVIISTKIEVVIAYVMELLKQFNGRQ